MTENFISFDKIQQIGKLQMSITQKIHGSNAQICIYQDEHGDIQILTGSRSRWVSPDNDNFGFSRFVYEHKEEFIEKLGIGRHFGEWAGPGINSGEGLKDKLLCLFNWRRWVGKELPPHTTIVPMLYQGQISMDVVNQTMERLKTEGSFLVPGFMKPEGIVIEVGEQLYKKVFDLEEVSWIDKAKKTDYRVPVDVSYLLQPLRLEKLLSKDEAYLRDYPESLGRICRDYIKDLEDENQFKSEDQKAERGALAKHAFYFIKSIVAGMGA